MQPPTNGMLNVDAALSDVAHIYRSITGRELPRDGYPVAPVPPERDPVPVAQAGLEQLGRLLQQRQPAAIPPYAPPVDCWESGRELVIDVDLPGIRRETLEVRIEGQLLLVRARREPTIPDGVRAAAHERPFGTLERRISLPPGCESKDAELRDGVLRIRLARRDAGGETRNIHVR